MTEQHKCAGSVWSSSLLRGYRACDKTARYEHDGKWYCKTHHPPHGEEKRRAYHAKWEAKFDAERAQREQRERERAEMQRKAAAYDGLLEALKMIAGGAPCFDNLMGDKDIARAAIAAVEGEKT